MFESDRRKAPRVEVDGPLSALALSTGRPDAPVQVVSVLNVSFGGFLVESGTPFEPGETYDFRFKTGAEKRPAVFKARAIYRVERSLADISATYACGFAFLHADDPFTLWRIRELMEEVTLALDAEHANSEPPADPAIA